MNWKLRFAVVTIVLTQSMTCGAQDPAKFMSASDQIVIHISDLSGLIDEALASDLADDERWEDVWKYLLHPEFGLMLKEDQILFGRMKTIIQSDLKVGRAVISLPRVKENRWVVSAEIRGDDPAMAIKYLVNCLKDISNSLSFESLNDDLILSSDEVGTRSGEASLFGLTLYWRLNANIFSFSNSRDLCGEVVERQTTSSNSEFTPLFDSRSYQTLSSVLTARRDGTNTVRVHVGLGAIAELAEVSDPIVAHTLGLSEVSALGVAVYFCESENPEKVELVFDSFARIAEPRRGIFDCIDLLGVPETVPNIPEDTSLFWYLNMDWERFSNGYKGLLDTIQAKRTEPGASGLTANELYRQARLKIIGNLRGQSWCLLDGDRVGCLDFEHVTDTQKMSELIVGSTVNSLQTPVIRYEACEYEEYPAVLASLSKRNYRVGAVFVNGWMYRGIEPVLAKAVSAPDHGGRVPSQVASMVSEIQKHIRLDGEISGLVAVFPRAVEDWQRQFVTKAMRDQVARDLKSKYPGEFEKLTVELNSATRKLEDFEFSEPKSRAESATFAGFIAGRIITDSFKKWIFVGTDEHGGFRIAGKSFRDSN